MPDTRTALSSNEYKTMQMKTKEGVFDVLSYPGGPVPVPQGYVLSVLTLSDGRILVDENIANLRAFRDYAMETVLWLEQRGVHSDTIRVSSEVMRTLQDKVYDPDQEQGSNAIADLLGDSEDDVIVNPPDVVEDAPAPAPPIESRRGDIAKQVPATPVSVTNSGGAAGPVTGDLSDLLGEVGDSPSPEDSQVWSHMKGHSLEVPLHLKEVLVIMSDGNVYLSESHARDKDVRYHLIKAHHVFQTLRIPVEEHLVSLDEIAAKVGTQEDSSAGSNTKSDAIRHVIGLLKASVKDGSSDIHIRVEAGKTSIIFRKNGRLKLFGELTRAQGFTLCTVIFNTMLSDSGGNPTFNPRNYGHGQLAPVYRPQGVFNVRLFYAPTSGAADSFTMVLRVQYGSGADGSVAFDTLGYTVEQTALMKYLAGLKTGITIFSGPMGSGKSTSLQSMLRYILARNPLKAGRGTHVVTLEDPVEYLVPGASQIPVVQGAFGEAARNIMRFDADTIMLGEIRDRETAGRSVEAALTGHNVLSTVHAYESLAIVRRLSDLGVAGDLLYDHTIFSGLISQRLLPVLCDSCKVLFNSPGLSELDLSVLDRTSKLPGVSMSQVYRQAHDPKCPKCFGEGLAPRGRTIVAEVVVTDAYLMTLLRQGDYTAARAYVYGEKGCRSIMENAIALIKAGKVDPRHVEDRVGWLATGMDKERVSVSDIVALVEAE